MPSSSTSTPRSGRSSGAASRWSRSIPRRRNWSGDFKNGGREWQPGGQPEEVRVHDFLDKELGKAIPYGVYDLTANQGWVSVGIDHDTAEFAVETLRRWWQQMGAPAYPGADRLLITADGGGSNGSRSRLWKVELQRLADETGLADHVCHFPPGRASGTRSSTGCSATSPRTGGAARWSATR